MKLVSNVIYSAVCVLQAAVYSVQAWFQESAGAEWSYALTQRLQVGFMDQEGKQQNKKHVVVT